MGESAARRATYDDLLAVPANQIAEILNGVLVTHPRPGALHARAASRLGAALDGPFDRGKGGPGGWVILDEPELHLHGSVVVPDLAGLRRERMPAVPMNAAAFELAPDWVCEVLSPPTIATDRADKLPLYAVERVARVWFVEPVARTLEVYELDGSSYRAAAAWRDAAVVRAAPFDAVELELGSIWTP
jgi:Uma2 family endonuclease